MKRANPAVTELERKINALAKEWERRVEQWEAPNSSVRMAPTFIHEFRAMIKELRACASTK